VVTTTTCQNCGEPVDADYARVFGNDDDQVHACTNCPTHRAIATGAATAADRDGAPLVHRPGIDEPVEAVMDETDDDVDQETDSYLLKDLRDQSPVGETQDASRRPTHDDSFAALAAE